MLETRAEPPVLAGWLGLMFSQWQPVNRAISLVITQKTLLDSGE
jgi:hypothetical protein